MVDSNLLLDPEILLWVLIPIFCVMFMQGILRNYLSQLLRDPPVPKLDAMLSKQTIGRSQRFRANMGYLPRASVNMRKKYFVEKVFAEPKKVVKENPDEPEMPKMPAQDPMAMMGMMKQNMAMVVPNMLLMGWVSFFFSGFVMVKLPFSLTDSFKSMLQRGVVLRTLDVSYVSALSWYFLNLFGLRGVFNVIMGAGNAGDGAAAMRAQMSMMSGGMAGGAGGPQQPQDPSALNKAEKTEVEITKHTFVVPDAEARLTQRYQAGM